VASWIIPHEKRRKPIPESKPHAAVAEATNRYYEREIADAKNPLRTMTDWIVARRSHTPKEID
jgi:hypothetical protein